MDIEAVSFTKGEDFSPNTNSVSSALVNHPDISSVS